MVDLVKWVLLILAAITFVILLIKAIIKIRGFFVKRKPTKGRNQSAPILEQETQQPTIDERARNELLYSAYRLEGILETLYQLGEGQMGNKEGIIFEWTKRINGIPDASYLQKAWKLASNGFQAWTDDEYQEYAKKVSHDWLLSDGGVKRDTRKDLIVQDGLENEYNTLNGEQLPTNTKAVVLRPCWYYNGRVLEKGIVREDK